MKGEVDVPSPDTIDPMTQTTSGLTLALSLDSSQNPTPRHQGVKNTGGTDEKLRVLQCTNVDLSLDYEGLYALMKGFGKVERMKLVLSSDKLTFTLYSTFFSSVCAHEANIRLNGHSVNGRSLITKLYSHSNIRDDDFDYIPTEFDSTASKKSVKDPPNLIWHVAAFKEGKDNMIKAAECIQRKVGKIPEENMKRYGKGILIKARNDTQAALLNNFHPPESSNILQMSPHKSFNTQRAIIYSKDLYEFSEEEILNMCPSNVCEVRKLKGSDTAIMLVLTSRYHMDSVCFNHVRIKVKKYRLNPTQCRSCFEYGHIASKCSLSPRCSNCSGLHQNSDCNKNKFCFQCNGAHSPTDKRCPRYKFEQEIRETVNTHHVSVGEAKKMVLNANKSPNSTFSSVVQGFKSSRIARSAAATNASLHSQPNLLSEATNLSISEGNTSIPSQIIPASLPSSSSDRQDITSSSYSVSLDLPTVNDKSSFDTKSISGLHNSAKKISSSKPRRSHSADHHKSQSSVESSSSPKCKKIKTTTSCDTHCDSDPLRSSSAQSKDVSKASDVDTSVNNAEMVDHSPSNRRESSSRSFMAPPSHSGGRSPPSTSRGRSKLTRDSGPTKPQSSRSKQGTTGNLSNRSN